MYLFRRCSKQVAFSDALKKNFKLCDFFFYNDSLYITINLLILISYLYELLSVHI